jgi:hypothetical protein
MIVYLATGDLRWPIHPKELFQISEMNPSNQR